MLTPHKGIVIAGRYALVCPLARGGMGSVWIARHRELDIDVTVKFMAPSLVEAIEARTRFEREAKVAARLRSQHVVQIHDYGVEHGTPYIVMELLTGEPLSAWLSREKRMPMQVAARLVVQVCKALRTAHEAGLVHRDLKPANIFLALKDEEEVVKVLDFGIVKAAADGGAKTDTQSGVFMGSMHYMSPEQVRSARTVDHRSDLWSVGVILYRVLTGTLPFPGASLVEVVMGVCHDPYPRASSIVPDLPARIDEFFSRALARDPENRFPSAMALAEAFSSMALAVPAPVVVMPRWDETVRMDASLSVALASTVDRADAAPIPPAGAGGADEITHEITTLKRAQAPRLSGLPCRGPSAPALENDGAPILPTKRKALPSAADRLTIAVAPEAVLEMLQGEQAFEPRADAAARVIVSLETATLASAVASRAPAPQAPRAPVTAEYTALPTAAASLTIAVAPNAPMGTPRAAQMADLKAEPAAQIVTSSTGHEHANHALVRGRSRWLYLVAAALVTLLGILGLALRSAAIADGAAGAPTATMSAAPSIARAAPPVTSATTSSSGSSITAPSFDPAHPAPIRIEDLPDVTNDARTGVRGDTGAQPRTSGQGSSRVAPSAAADQATKRPPTAASAAPPIVTATPKSDLRDRRD